MFQPWFNIIYIVFDVEAPFVSCTNFLLVVGLSQQQFDQTLGVDPHSSSSFDQTSLVPCARIFCQLQANHVGFPQFDIHPVLRNIFKFRDNTTFLEFWLKRKVFVVQEDFPMKRTIKTMDHDTIVTNSDYRQ